MLESLVANPGELHAMVAYGASALGLPCFSGVRLVDCSGEYPGGEPGNQPLPNAKLSSPNAQGTVFGSSNPWGSAPPGSNPSY